MPEVQRADEDVIVNLPVEPSDATPQPRERQPAPAGPQPSAELPADLAARRAETQRQRMDATGAITDVATVRMEQDRQRAVEAFEATGIQPGELQPWDHEQQRERFRTDPIESFGSVASVFAILASAFTKAPMQNALNGAAAAMTAIKEGNDREFERAFEAWQKNNQLAVQRHSIMNQQYHNAITLMNTDMAQGRAQLQMLAARFDDQQLLTLMEHGMDPQGLQLIAGRNQAITSAAEAMPRITKMTLQMRALDVDPEMHNDDPDLRRRVARQLNAYRRIMMDSNRSEDVAFAQFMYEGHGQRTKEEIADFIQRMRPSYGSRSASDARTVEDVRADVRSEHPDWTAGQIDLEANRRFTASRSVAGSREDTVELNRRKQELRERNESLPENQRLTDTQIDTQVRQDMARAKATLTPNRLDDIRRVQNFVQLSRGVMDKAETLINRHFGITGIGGMITRPMEAISNMAALSNETDRAQFRRYIDELKEWAPTVLLQRSGRPLSAEAARLDRIIGGLSPGDTAANTRRAFKEMRELWTKIEQQLQERTQAVPPSATTPGAGQPARAQPSGTNWWQNLPDRARQQPATGE